MTNKEPAATECASSGIHVWDTEYCPSSKAFSTFREAICSTFMPWSPEFKSEQTFEGRVSGLSFKDGSIARVGHTPLVATRTKSDIASSPVEGFYANFVISGEIKVEQAGSSIYAKRGDLVVYDSSLPVVLTEKEGIRYEDISFMMPKPLFSTIKDAEGHLSNMLITRDKLISPLSGVLNFLAGSMSSLSEEELIALYSSCVSLLPLAAGCFDHDIHEETDFHSSNNLLPQILDFVNQNISDVKMSPRFAAENFGISARYVHKLFAVSSTTFSSYVVSKRLDHIREDLLSPGSRNQPISILAFRWGFKDLSSFNRAFKNRFGCSPTRFRSHFGN